MASTPPVGNGAGVTLRTTMAILQQLQGIFSAQVVLKLFIRITGGALKKYRCLGPNYQEKLMLVFLGNEAYSFVLLKSPQMVLMCGLSS